MKIHCPRCPYNATQCPPYVSKGHYYRKSDSRWIRRFRCKQCYKNFSLATFNACYGQNKRRANEPLRKLLCSAVSMRRSAIILGINRKTVARKLKFLARIARTENAKAQQSSKPAKHIQFDELETFEHTRCKPISVLMAVERNTRRILAFEASPTRPTKHIKTVAIKRYGQRRDGRLLARRQLFARLESLAIPTCLFDSDQHPHYPRTLKEHFPRSEHRCYKSRRATMTGMGELKTGGYDPLFDINHTLAMNRANISRLLRKTWCTTKKLSALIDHLDIYMHFHNSRLLKKSSA